MHTNIHQYFRYYLAAFLSILLAVGVRLQAAPLGTDSLANEEVNKPAATEIQARTVHSEVAFR